MERKKTVIALGYFDSVHSGHVRVISKAKEIAKSKGLSLVVFTFSKSLGFIIESKEKISVFSNIERDRRLKNLGADEIYYAPVNKTFLSKGKRAFLNHLNSLYDISYYVCGKDYRFGKFGSGDVDYLEKYATSNNQNLTVCDILEFDGEKISTSNIKSLLKEGKIEKVNSMLSENYSITGKVFEDRKIGTKLGFPTVNICIEKNLLVLKDGVYYGKTFIDNKWYKVIINYGARPTYSLDEKLIEGHIIGFNGNLYGKNLTIFFNGFLREVKKFSSEKELIERLNLDLKTVLEFDYD